MTGVMDRIYLCSQATIHLKTCIPLSLGDTRSIVQFSSCPTLRTWQLWISQISRIFIRGWRRLGQKRNFSRERTGFGIIVLWVTLSLVVLGISLPITLYVLKLSCFVFIADVVVPWLYCKGLILTLSYVIGEEHISFPVTYLGSENHMILIRMRMIIGTCSILSTSCKEWHIYSFRSFFDYNNKQEVDKEQNDHSTTQATKQ